MQRRTRFILIGLLFCALADPALAQWPALYFRADPLLRLDLARPRGGSNFGVAVYSYSAESYFDGRDLTPHTSKANASNVRFQREEYIFAGQIGLSDRTAIVGVVPVSHVKQRLFETGDWGVEKLWFGVSHALDAKHRYSVVFVGAVPMDGPVGELHLPVTARDNSGFVTAQFVLNHESRTRFPSVYLRTGVGMYTSKEDYYGRRLYEFPGEVRIIMRVTDPIRLGIGSEGRFVVGAPDNRLFSNTLTSHDAFAFGPHLVIRLTPHANLHATYRHEVIGFYATAGSYWNIAMTLTGSNR